MGRHSIDDNPDVKVIMIGKFLHRRCKNCKEFFADGEKKKCPGRDFDWKKKAIGLSTKRGLF